MYTQRVQKIEGKSRVEDFYRKDEPKCFFCLLISLVILSVMFSLVWGGCVYTCINL